MNLRPPGPQPEQLSSGDPQTHLQRAIMLHIAQELGRLRERRARSPGRVSSVRLSAAGPNRVPNRVPNSANVR